tara:strand:- start:787 stop:1170 length:384 start_codon:yes stop_codon:yes gene_type:complete
MNKLNISSNRSFGVVFFLVFLLISIYPLLNNQNIRLWSLLISLIFLILGLLNSSILSPFNKLWFEVGILLGKIISPLVMSAIFFFVVTPTGFIMKMFKKDLLNLEYNNNESYWIIKKEPKSKMKDQF